MLHQKDGFRGERMIVLPPMIVDIEKQDPLVSSLYITDIGYFPAAANHYRKRNQPINEYVLIYCVKGHGWYELRGEHYEVKENEFFILPAGEPHAYGADKEPWTIYWVHFSGKHADIFSRGLQKPHRIATTIDSRIGERNNLFEEIINTLHDSYDLDHLRYVSSLLHYYLGSMCFLRIYRNATHLDPSTDPVQAAIHYMKENIEHPISLNDISQYIGYSVSHFSTLFKNQIGQSVLSYNNLIKIQRACEMLTETDMKINQIAYKVGIEDSYYFSRLFSKIMKMSPTDYREMVQKHIS